MDGRLNDGAFACETESNSFKQELRRAAKDVLYMYLNARYRNQQQPHSHRVMEII